MDSSDPLANTSGSYARISDGLGLELWIVNELSQLVAHFFRYVVFVEEYQIFKELLAQEKKLGARPPEER